MPIYKVSYPSKTKTSQPNPNEQQQPSIAAATTNNGHVNINHINDTYNKTGNNCDQNLNVEQVDGEKAANVFGSLKRPSSKLRSIDGETIVEREIRLQLMKEKEIEALRSAALYTLNEDMVQTASGENINTLLPVSDKHTVYCVSGHFSGQEEQQSNAGSGVNSYKMMFESNGKNKQDHVDAKNQSQSDTHNRNVQKKSTVQPFEDVDEEFQSKLRFIQPQSETVIEKEVRLTRQREGSLRRAKGYPLEFHQTKSEINVEIPVLSSSSQKEEGFIDNHSYDSSNRVKGDQLNSRRLATNRLKQEIMKERQREVDLRKQGKIVTLSEERAALDAAIIEELVAKELEERQRLEALKIGPSSHERLSDSHSYNIKSTGTLPKHPTNNQMPSIAVSVNTQDKKEKRNTEAFSRTSNYDDEIMNAESRIEEEIKDIKQREQELREQRRVMGIPTSPTTSTQPTYVSSYRRRR